MEEKTYVAVMDYQFGRIHLYTYDGDLECEDVEQKLTGLGFKMSNVAYMCSESPISVDWN